MEEDKPPEVVKKSPSPERLREESKESPKSVDSQILQKQATKQQKQIQQQQQQQQQK